MARPKKTTDSVDCIVLRDFWVTADDRKREGTVVSLSVDDAFDKIEAGLVKRHKPE